MTCVPLGNASRRLFDFRECRFQSSHVSDRTFSRIADVSSTFDHAAFSGQLLHDPRKRAHVADLTNSLISRNARNVRMHDAPERIQQHVREGSARYSLINIRGISPRRIPPYSGELSPYGGAKRESCASAVENTTRLNFPPRYRS